MPLNWKSKVLLAKTETVYGTDSAPTGAANAILATDIRLSPMEGQDVSRNLEYPYLGAQATVPTELHAKLAFRVELTPSGTRGTAPPWGVLLRACGCAQVIVAATSVTYNPVTSTHESVTIHMWIDGTQYKLLGARGTCVMRINAQGIPYLEFDFTGLWVLASDVAQAVPTIASQLTNKPVIATSANTPTFTYNAVPLVMRSFALNLGNQVETRFLVRSESVLITDRAETIETTVEAVPLATLNPYALARDQTTAALTLTHGTVAGKIATLSAPAAQLQRPAGLENQQNIVEWPLRMVPIPVSGNDQWTLALT